MAIIMDGRDAGQILFHSDTALNDDKVDHMLAYQGVSEPLVSSLGGTWIADYYVLAWEDLNGGGDWDYNDFVLMSSISIRNGVAAGKV